MKNKVSSHILMLLMLIFLTPFTANADTSSAVSIQQLYSSKIDYWDGEYEAHGRTISFHAPVFIPDVETMPVLTVTSNGIEDMTIPENLVLLYHHANGQFLDKVGDLKTGYWRTKYFYFPWSEEGKRDAAACFAENNSVSLADAIADVANIVDQVWGEGVYGVVANRAQVLSPILTRNGEIYDFSDMPGWEAYTGKGLYILDLWLTLRGIPVFMGAGYGFEVPGNSSYTTLGRPSELSIGLYLKPGDYCDLSASTLFKETGVLMEDIPLCPFEEIQSEVERLIEKGNIRNVFGLRLGYVVFQKQNETYNYKSHTYEMANAEYVAVPTWVVECTYAKNANTKITTNPTTDDDDEAEEIPYYGDYGFETLMIHAQTGKAYDPYSTSSSQKEYLKALRALPIAEW